MQLQFSWMLRTACYLVAGFWLDIVFGWLVVMHHSVAPLSVVIARYPQKSAHLCQGAWNYEKTCFKNIHAQDSSYYVSV